MTMNSKVQSMLRDVQHRARESRGRTQPATGHHGRAEELKNRLSHFAHKIRVASKR
jgi:hypothetical protein